MTNYPMFRFAIRDVLWLTVVVALAIALWRESTRNDAAYLEGAASEAEVWRELHRAQRAAELQGGLGTAPLNRP
jgi:hypothetical protein